MASIQQNFSLNSINSLLPKYGNTDIQLNVDNIRSDIQRLDTELSNLKLNKLVDGVKKVKELEYAIEFLNRLIDKTEDGVLSLGWNVTDNVIKSYPIELIDIPNLKIHSTDYIKLDKEKIVFLDYKQLVDIIAFEIMHRDLGEDHKSIESLLTDIGIVGIRDCDILTNYFKEDMYRVSKFLRVSDSPYLIPGTKYILDYFGKKEFKATTYEEVVFYSAKEALSLVVESMLKKCKENSIEIKLCSITDLGIYLIVNGNIKDSLWEIIKENVYVRAFGRNFEVKPSITIY